MMRLSVFAVFGDFSHLYPFFVDTHILQIVSLSIIKLTMKTLRSDYLRQIKRKLTVYVAFDSFFFLWIDSLHKIIKNLKATTWLSHFWMYPFFSLHIINVKEI